MTSYDVCGSYPGATPWTVDTDESPACLAERLASSAGCSHYTVDGVTYGPFRVTEQTVASVGCVPVPCEVYGEGTVRP